MAHVQQGTYRVFTVHIHLLCACRVTCYPGYPETKYPGEMVVPLSSAAALQMAKSLSMKTGLPIIFRWSAHR